MNDGPDAANREGRLVAGAFLSLFGALAAQALLETARDALFLTHIPIARLPLVHLALAALTLVAAAVVPAGRRGAGSRATPLSLLVGALVTAGLGLALDGGSGAAVYGLFVWSGTFTTFTVARVWTVLGESLDVSRAKRMYGRVAAGGGLGAVFGAGLARLLSERAPPHVLVLLAALMFAATALGPALSLRRGSTNPSRSSNAPRTPVATSVRPARAIAHPYVVRLLIAAVLAAAVSTLLDFSFKESVVTHVSPARLPAFFASFHLVTSTLSLLVQLFGVGWLIEVAGVKRAPVVFPTLLLTGWVVALVSGGVTAIVLLRGADAALRNSLHRAAFELLQVPLGNGLRRRSKLLIDAVGLRAGQALASLGLLLTIGLSGGAGPRLALAGGLIAIWAGFSLTLGRRYVDLLRVGLLDPVPAGRSSATTLTLDPDARAPLPDAGSFEELAAALVDCDHPLWERATLPAALVAIDPVRSVAPLLDGLLLEHDASIQLRILRALNRARRADPRAELDEDILSRAAITTVQSAYRYLAWRLFLEDGAARLPARRTPTWKLLRDLLAAAEQGSIERLFLILNLRHPREDFPGLLRTLRNGDRRTRAASRELIESLLEGPAQTLTLALVDDVSDRDRLSALARGESPRAPTYRDLLAAIRTEEGDGKLAALAARHATELARPIEVVGRPAPQAGDRSRRGQLSWVAPTLSGADTRSR